MTTLAYRDGVLASDSRATWDDGTMGKCVKIYRLVSKVDPVKGPLLLGGAGSLYALLLFHDWLVDGGEPKLYHRGVDEEDDFDALIVHKKGIFVANRLCRIDALNEDFWACGSGRHAALAAMMCGKSAVDAVRIAARIDPFTGGRVVHETLEKEKRRGR